MSLPVNTIVQGDSEARLAELPAGCAQLVLTSPPYWGLRDYRAAGADGQAQSLAGQWGREPTPEAHVERLVGWGRAVRRVLRDDGVLVLNYGESYSSGSARGETIKDGERVRGAPRVAGQPWSSQIGRVPGFKAKDLLGMPWRIAMALQADGWYWRAWWPWVKANGMPESVRDRPALSCEVMLMFSKRARYYWDQEAVRVGYAPATIERADGSQVSTGNPDVRPGFKRTLTADANGGHGRIRKTGDWHRESVALAAEQARRDAGSLAAWAEHAERWLAHGGALLDLDGLPLGQLHPTYAYPGSHFATFPPALVRPVIRAATSERGQCPACGAPWVREVSISYVDAGGRAPHEKYSPAMADGSNGGSQSMQHGRASRHSATTGWRASCACEAGEPVPQLVLDPFGGTGTTCVVAAEEGRRALGIDLYGGDYDFGGHTANQRIAEAIARRKLQDSQLVLGEAPVRRAAPEQAELLEDEA